MSNGNTRWITAKIREDYFDAINHLASFRGQQQRALIPEIIARGLEVLVEETKNPPPELELWRIINQLEKTERTEAMLKNLGYKAKISQNTAIMDLFEEQCQQFGYDSSDLLQDINLELGPTPIDIKSNGVSVVACERWLQQIMIPGEEYQQRDIKSQAKVCGFPEHVLNKAKRNQGIESVKRSKCWSWVLPAKGRPRIVPSAVLPDDDEHEESKREMADALR